MKEANKKLNKKILPTYKSLKKCSRTFEKNMLNAPLRTPRTHDSKCAPNPLQYHCKTHAADVLRTLYCVLTHGGIAAAVMQEHKASPAWRAFRASRSSWLPCREWFCSRWCS